MFTQDDILLPLAITVIIDTKVKDSEVAAFCTHAQSLLALFGLPVPDTDTLRAWFSAHETDIQDKLSGRRRNTYVLRVLTRFNDDMHVENLYEAILAISISDKQYVREESDLVKSAASLWGYDRPPLKISS